MSFEGQPDLSALLAQAQQMQQGLLDAQRRLDETVVEGSAGGGLVTASVTGSGTLVTLKIQPSAVDPADVETLEDLVVAAVHDAMANAQAVQEQLMGPVTQGLGGLAGGLGGGLGGGLPGLPGGL